MKKALKTSKLAGTSKFVRRVLSKSSNVASKSGEISSDNSQLMDNPDPPENVETASLKEQVKILQLTVNSMQEDTEKKEKALATLAREKEKLSSDLKKQKRSNTSLKQQLEEERDYYYKEKEQYCQEISEYKKMRKVFMKAEKEPEETSTTNPNPDYAREVQRLKMALNQTLEANYNLSVKFLRMKNTKTFLKNKLKALESERDKALDEFRHEVEDLKNEINELASKLFQSPISPSNKKFLKVVKQNGNLVHENLCLQLEVDQLKEELYNIKGKLVKTESRNKLQYIPKQKSRSESKERSESSKAERSKPKKETRSSKRSPMRKIQEESTERSESSNLDRIKSERSTREEGKKAPVVKKLYEKEETEGVPIITMLPAQVEFYTDDDVSNFKSVMSISHGCGSLDLVQISENPSQISNENLTSYSSSRHVMRTQSAPEIVSSSSYNINCN